MSAHGANRPNQRKSKLISDKTYKSNSKVGRLSSLTDESEEYEHDLKTEGSGYFSDSSDGNLHQKRNTGSFVGKQLSKVAMIARENRLKHKAYVHGLEDKVKRVNDSNKILKNKVQSQAKMISTLQKHVQYLKGIIHNSTELGSIIKTLQTSPLFTVGVSSKTMPSGTTIASTCTMASDHSSYTMPVDSTTIDTELNPAIHLSSESLSSGSLQI